MPAQPCLSCAFSPPPGVLFFSLQPRAVISKPSSAGPFVHCWRSRNMRLEVPPPSRHECPLLGVPVLDPRGTPAPVQAAVSLRLTEVERLHQNRVNRDKRKQLAGFRVRSCVFVRALVVTRTVPLTQAGGTRMHTSKSCPIPNLTMFIYPSG